MLCDICHENEAVINVTEISSEGRRERHLCKACASKRSGGEHPFASLADPAFIMNLLKGVIGGSDEKEEPESLKKTNVVCAVCGKTYDEFVKDGTFGCPDCYRTFNFLLDAYLKKVHGNSRHVGRRPVFQSETIHIPDWEEGADTDADRFDEEIEIIVDNGSSVRELKLAVKRALDREDYEEAARLRDLIKAQERGAEDE